MKQVKVLVVLLITSVFLITGCKDNDSAAKDAARNSLNVPETVAPVTPPVAPSTGLVNHYICPNNCEGSGGPAAGNCPVCGTAYTHNQAYHNQPANTTQADPASATNAAGVYHYICSNGCAGGSGSQGSCATCGSALVHNQAYHN